ncbi:MAG TPA: hypothetical protein VMT45_02430, partial [Thermoanaerobaculaceae bacterium]|nr:hypothetical protein [Thermoanaerobaculaceae bacterium]
MKSYAGLATLALMCLPFRLVAQENCSYGPLVSVTSGSDERGYYIRTEWKVDFYRPRRGYDVCAVGDLVAH